MDRIDKLLNPPKWKPKEGEIVFSVKADSDFIITIAKFAWADNNKLLAQAFAQGMVFRYADEAFALSKQLNGIINVLKNNNYGR